MEMPKPTTAHARLTEMAGRWTGEERLSPSPWDPKGGVATAVADNRLALDGFALIQDYAQSREGMPNFLGHGVLTYDSEGKAYQMHWFDSMGMPPSVYRGDFEGSVLKMTASFPAGTSRCSWELGRPKEYRFLLEVSADGKNWQTMIDGTYRKQG